MLSFDVNSLLANVPIRDTIDCLRKFSLENSNYIGFLGNEQHHLLSTSTEKALVKADTSFAS